MFFMLLIYISNFMSIRYYLLYDLSAYILYIILNYKSVQFEQFIDNITIDFLLSRNFASTEVIRKRCNSTVNLSPLIK